jgi:ParB family transcriptional regulator, chromosome partitioning protein
VIDPMRAISENLIRAEMGQVDRWRAMESLAAAGWNEAAIAEALGMTPRNIAQARLLANICPAMLDQMAKNDLPDRHDLRVIAAATKEEQAEVWKRLKPKRGHAAPWSGISHALSKTRLMAKNAKFGEAEMQAFGIVWEDDLFAPADEDGRSTTQVDAFLAAQTAWLEANLAEGDCIVAVDEYYRPQLPKGAQQHYGRRGDGVLTAFSIEPRSGLVRETYFTMPQRRSGATACDADVKPTRASRPDLTAKGAAMVGDLRTDALHQALREKPIDDDQLISMLVLALAGRNVTVLSGVAGSHRANLGRIAETLTEGGVLTRDLAMIRNAARETLVQVLSCRENHSASGMGARYAGTAIDADAYLPNMATEAFLPALSRAALEQSAATHSVAPQARVKDTRAALIARFAGETFVYPGARFAPTTAELEARRNPASIFGEGDAAEDSGDVAIDGAPGERNDDGRDDHDPIGEDDEATALPDDDEP